MEMARLEKFRYKIQTIKTRIGMLSEPGILIDGPHHYYRQHNDK